MIKSKLMLYISLFFLFAYMILNFPFPHKYPYGEAVFMLFNIPIRFADGFHTVGITTLLLLIIGLYFLVKSLKNCHGRIVFIVILVVCFAPTAIVTSFQKTFATDIYAISYSSKDSNCNFEMKSERRLQGECELRFKNYSNKDVQFTVEFYENPAFKNNLPIVSLMNNKAPYEVTIGKKESKNIRIKTDIDVSDMEDRIDSGKMTGVNIKIKSKDNSRNL